MARKGGRRRHPIKKRVEPGASPGTLVTEPGAPAPQSRVLSWRAGVVDEAVVTNPSELREIISQHAVTWVDVDGLGNAPLIEEIGKVLDLHPLALEDVLSQSQRPKVEDYGTNLFVAVQMVYFADERVTSEQLSLFLGEGFVATFQGGRPGDCLDPVRERVRRGGRLWQSGPDYLAYAIIDTAIDYYFPVADQIGDSIERLEDELMIRLAAESPQRIQRLKQDLLTMRRITLPMRDVAGNLAREENRRIRPETRIFFRDVYDHTTQLIDVLNVYRELVMGLTDLYITGLSNRMNEVMKFLTLIATVFIPLTFIVGIYGMNFDTSSPWNMPELKWRYGYPAVLLAMLVTAVSLVWYFKRKGWLGPTR